MRQYEVMYIVRPDLDEERTQELVEKFRTLVNNNGGEVTSVEPMGKRRLAYEIEKYREGYYVVMKFNGRPETVKELDRVLKITDGILRHLIVREDE